jgi:hypothetical protein
LRAELKRAQAQLPHQVVDGVAWYWPADEDPRRIGAGQGADGVRFLAPFDPVVWDRGRFESFWGWTYRFEAYTPQRRRKLGYYAMPVLWRDDVVGWVNLAMQAGALAVDLGFAAGRAPAHRNFRRELDAEVERVREFLHAP